MNWRGRRVLVTGHTGFKGGWLALWLAQLGAEVCGLALAPAAAPNLFTDAQIDQVLHSVLGDIRDADLVRRVVAEFKPEVVLHLAAQALVRASYADPIGTYATNAMGTAHVLDAVRRVDSVRAVVVVTTDKCYENREWVWAYRETDRLGGYDPYSNSKACAELVVSSYRSSFFPPGEFARHGVAVASARAGNVIGGGDWSVDRLVPDAVRAFATGEPLKIRNPLAVRPWQHVLDPLAGYLRLAEALHDVGVSFGEAWNFGPEPSDVQPVEWVANELLRLWGNGASWDVAEGAQPHEAQLLKLDVAKSKMRLKWQPLLALPEALAWTADWYKKRLHGVAMRLETERQIKDYEGRMRQTPGNGAKA
jgi:CDP-glucose 4,6-dehydratase